MVEIKLLSNGFELTGHASEVVCGEISTMTWFVMQTAFELDEGMEFEEKHGYAKMAINTSDEKVLWLLDVFKKRIKEWAEKHWGSQVKITE